MAYFDYYGPEQYERSHVTYQIWHRGYPAELYTRNTVMGGTGRLNVSRNGSTVSGYISSPYVFMVNSGWYNLPVTINVLANGVVVATHTETIDLDGAGDSQYFNGGDNICSFSYNDNSEITFRVEYLCGESGGCTQINYKPMAGSVTISSYNPWTDPTNLKNVSVTPASIKPEGNVTVSWTKAQAGTGNSISKYQVQFKDSADSGWTNYSDNISSSTSSVTYQPLSYRAKIKPGETLSFRVRAYCSSSTSGHDSYWMGWVNAGSTVSVYKDGSIIYKNSGGGTNEVTKVYVKDGSGNTQKVRYARVKDGNGNQHVIDVYTTHYE